MCPRPSGILALEGDLMHATNTGGSGPPLRTGITVPYLSFEQGEPTKNKDGGPQIFSHSCISQAEGYDFRSAGWTEAGSPPAGGEQHNPTCWGQLTPKRTKRQRETRGSSGKVFHMDTRHSHLTPFFEMGTQEGEHESWSRRRSVYCTL